MFSRFIRRGSSRVSSVLFAERNRIVMTYSMFMYSASACAFAPKRQTPKSSTAPKAIPATPKHTKPNKETPPSPRKSKPKNAKPVPEDPLETIDAARVVEEWRAICAEAPAASPESPSANDRSPHKSPAAAATAAAAAMGAMLARVAKHSDERPALYGFLHARRADVHGAEVVVRDTSRLCGLLAFLRVYRTSAFGCAAVHAATMDALVRAASTQASSAPSSSSSSRRGAVGLEEMDWESSPRAALLWLALELRRLKLEREPQQRQRTNTRSDWVSAETASRLAAALSSLSSYSSSYSYSSAPSAKKASGPWPVSSVARAVADLALLLLSSAPAESTARAESTVDALLRSGDHSATAHDAQRRAQDLLAALRLLSLAEVALPPNTGERFRRGASDAFQRLCATPGTQSFVFADVLCAPDVVQAVHALPARDMRDAVEAAVFAGAGLFCECASEEAVEALFSRAKENAEPSMQMGESPKHNRTKEGTKEEEEEEEKEKEENELEFALQLRTDGDGAVELYSRRAKIAYALFAAGYSPNSVLSSGLCGAHGAADILEILRAAALFSRAFAFAPLPQREAAALTAGTTALVDRCIRHANRAEAVAEEILHDDGPPPLRDLLERGARRESSNDPNSDSDSDAASVLRVLFAAATEFLVRGEERRFADHFARLLVLLEREGSWDYLVDGLAVLVDGFAERCRVAGSHGTRAIVSNHHNTNNINNNNKSNNNNNNRSNGNSNIHNNINEETTAVASSSSAVDGTATAAAECDRCLSEAAALCASRVADAAQRTAARARRTVAHSPSSPSPSYSSSAYSYSSSMTGEPPLLDAALRLTATAAACGIDEAAARRLVHVHVTALKAAGPQSTQLAQSVQRLHVLVTRVRARRQELCRVGARGAGALLYDVAAVHLAAARSAAAPQLHDALAAVSLLFRLADDYTAVAEPAELRAFRTDVLDAALTRALKGLRGRAVDSPCGSPKDHHSKNTKNNKNNKKEKEEKEKEESTGGDALDLAALGEVAVVMCAEHTIHHISAEFLDELAAATEAAVSQRKERNAEAAARILLAVAPVCRLRRDQRTECFLRMAAALGPLLRATEQIAVLSACDAAGAPIESAAVAALRKGLAASLRAPDSALAAPDAMAALSVLRGAAGVPVATVLRRVFFSAGGGNASVSNSSAGGNVSNSSGGGLGAGDAGAIARIAGPLLAAAESTATTKTRKKNHDAKNNNSNENNNNNDDDNDHGDEDGGEDGEGGEGGDDDDAAFLYSLPAALADAALRGRQHCPAADVPRVLTGFAQFHTGAHTDVQQRVMRAYILRTIQTCPQLSALAVVECLESYVAARISHEYLYGVLLARVTDARVKFSLPLAVRLVECGAHASWDKSVQTACLTAARPVFLGFVRRMLQSDPAALPAVSSHAVVVLQCLAGAFPNDPTGDLVLQCMTTYHAALTTPTMIAVLRLISRKASTEYTVLRCMTDHAVGALFPRASPNEFVELTLLLVQCGVRTRTLFEGIAQRFAALRSACDGCVLATLAEAFTIAHVDLEPEVIAMLVDRTVELAQEMHKQKGHAIISGKGKRKAIPKRSQEGGHANEEENDGTIPSQADIVFRFELPHCIALLKLFALLDPEQTRRATSLLLNCAADALRMGAAADSPADIDVLLAACVRVAPVPSAKSQLQNNKTEVLTQRCADALLRALETQQPAGWQADIALLVQLAAHLVRLNLSAHAAVPLLFDILYERRSALMRRRLLLESATEAIEGAGEAAHQQLYALLVNGKLIA